MCITKCYIFYWKKSMIVTSAIDCISDSEINYLLTFNLLDYCRCPKVCYIFYYKKKKEDRTHFVHLQMDTGFYI